MSALAPWLSDQNRRELEVDSAVDPLVIAERGYRTIMRPTNANDEPRREVERLGIPRWATKEDRYFPGLLIPMYRPTGELISWQFKPSTPPKDPKTGKPRKYASVKGQTNRIDVHPRNHARIADPTVDLWITEGIKKADSLTSKGECVIALTGVFNWRSQLGTLGDWEDVPLKGRDVILCFDADARTNMNVARAMARLGAWLKSKGAKGVGYVIVPSEVNGTKVKGVDDYFAAGGDLAGLGQVATTKPPNTEIADGTFSDAYLADTIADEVLASRFRWSAGLGWLEWDGTRWARCPEAAVLEAVRLYAIDRFQHVLAGMRTDEGQAGNANALNGWRSVLGKGRMGAIVNLCRGIVLVRDEELDAYPDLLNVANGVVDLATGELLEHDPALLMTKLAPVVFDPEAKHEDWDATLRAVPEDVREWYQVRLGQGITGHMTPDDRLLVQVGGGENGKTTLTSGVEAVLGDYFVQVPHRAILANADAHPTELMTFRGARFALLEETPEERRLNVTRLKQAVGTPTITARLIRQDSVTFEATHSLFLSTNYLPTVEESDHGTWRRLACVRFPFRWLKRGEEATGPNDREGDPTLRDRIRSGANGQHEAILTWLVQGASKWYAAGRVMPELPVRIAADTRSWRAETDLVQAYMAERLEPDPGSHVLCRELLADFNDWLASNGHRPWSDRTFASRFGGHSDAQRHHVERAKLRRSAGLSRPAHFMAPGVPRVPPPIAEDQYKAWVGIRFARKEGV